MAHGTPNVCAAAILRPGDAEAQLEPIPGTDGLCFGGFWAALLGAGAGRAAIGYGFPRETGDTDWFYREWTPAGWGDPELVTTQPLSRRVIRPGGILSRDGSRAALFLSWPVYRYADSQTYVVFARGRLGGWRELTLGPGFPQSASMRGGGYLGDERMWVLALTDAPFQATTTRYALYEER